MSGWGEGELKSNFAEMWWVYKGNVTSLLVVLRKGTVSDLLTLISSSSFNKLLYEKSFSLSPRRAVSEERRADHPPMLLQKTDVSCPLGTSLSIEPA